MVVYHSEEIIVKKLLSFGFLVFIPISFAAEYLHWGAISIFVTCCLAIIPLASWLSSATEEIAVVLGPSWGGLMNATFGNVTELIIGLVALKSGLVEVVKASITGSILGNLLLVMGLAMFLGGVRFKEQEFQPMLARTNASVMNLAVISLLIPTAVNFTSMGIQEVTLQNLSIAISIILILVYGATLLFAMKTHSYLYDVGITEISDADGEVPEVNLWLWIGVLLVCTALVAIESEFLVGSLTEATTSLGLSALFTGVIVLPIIGNAAEHSTAVTVAMKNKMDLSVSVSVGSSMQIALFVAPALVLGGYFLGQPMDLNFNPFELVAVAVSVLIVNSISSDGRSNWLEGVLLLSTYIILGIAFYTHPVA